MTQFFLALFMSHSWIIASLITQRPSPTQMTYIRVLDIDVSLHDSFMPLPRLRFMCLTVTWHRCLTPWLILWLIHAIHKCLTAWLILWLIHASSKPCSCLIHASFVTHSVTQSHKNRISTQTTEICKCLTQFQLNFPSTLFTIWIYIHIYTYKCIHTYIYIYIYI